jgi:hypothetical protein
MQAGGPPRPCCSRLITFSFTRFNNGILTYSFDDAEYDKQNGGKDGETSNISSEDQEKMRKDFYNNPDSWIEDPNDRSQRRQTFKRLATFCDGTNKIERFGN